MNILNGLIYKAGGYSLENLENASDTERRQILQLGSAVFFSITASIISWCAASTRILDPNAPLEKLLITFFLIAVVVFFISMSVNRNMIFYSDMRKPKEKIQSGSLNKKEALNTLPYFRIALVVGVSILNTQVFDEQYGYLIIFVLGFLELYPLLVKLQMGQTILGSRMQAKMAFEHDRAKLKRREYDREIEESDK